MLDDKILITMPAHNEESTIKQVIDNIKHNMMDYDYQIQVVDDGSSDKTAEIAKENGAIVISHPKRYGLAETFRTEMEGCLKADVDIIVHIDADGQYKARDIPLLINALKQGNDLVIGSRFLGTIESMPFIKKIGNIVFSKVISSICGIKITDAQSGMRCFFKKNIKKIKIVSTYTYTHEQIIRAVKNKFKVKEVPVYFAKRGGESRLMKSPFEYAVKAWINILRVYRDYEPLKFYWTIGGTLMAFGFILGCYIIGKILLGYGSGGIPRIILSAMMFMTGLQICLSGLGFDKQRD